MSAPQAITLAVLVVALLALRWWIRGIDARDQRDPRDGDLGVGWRRCWVCDEPFWQPDGRFHAACEHCESRGVR